MEKLDKNITYDVEICDYTSEGAGVARINGEAVFVTTGARGDKCAIRITDQHPNYAWAKIEKFYEPSPERIKSDCPAFPKCGGCAMRHVSYEEELRFKSSRALEAMRRIGGIEPEYEGITGANNLTRYRNKAQYPIRFQQGKTVAGFYRVNSHEVVLCSDCLIESEASTRAVRCVVGYMNRFRVPAYDERTNKGLIRHVYVRTAKSGEAIVCIVATSENLPAKKDLVGMLRAECREIVGIHLNVNTRNDNVIMSGPTYTLWGDKFIEEELLGRRFKLGIDSFFQINRAQAEKLYMKAGEYLGNADEVLDLYCGVGSIGICLSDRINHLTGVEVVKGAVENARENALLNGIKDARFICADAGKAAEQLASENYHPDAIIVDPPRKGLDSVCIDAITKLSPEKIVYVSCNPATQARDAALLAARGYTVRRMSAVDMFPRTAHVETVCLLVRRNGLHIDIDVDVEKMLQEKRGQATYPQIKEYVLEQTGMKVSSLYISQVKHKCGMEVGDSYNKPKSENSKVPQCPPEKETAIKEALKHFGMI